ncbi:hypothetical protein U1Q18_009594 [Sarracenia purpurea var. burkii]
MGFICQFPVHYIFGWSEVLTKGKLWVGDQRNVQNIRDVYGGEFVLTPRTDVELFGNAKTSERENIYVSLDQRYTLSENVVKRCRMGRGENIFYVEPRRSSPFFRCVIDHQDSDPKNGYQGNREEHHNFR